MGDGNIDIDCAFVVVSWAVTADGLVESFPDVEEVGVPYCSTVYSKLDHLMLPIVNLPELHLDAQHVVLG